jgi:hypothetical protein
VDHLVFHEQGGGLHRDHPDPVAPVAEPHLRGRGYVPPP